MTIPVICDRCRTAGTAGAGDFSHLGDLLEFDPVPRRARVNGWHAEAQRAFIALLATTGSKIRAARAIGRNPVGIDQLLKAPDSASFAAAYDRAMEIARSNGMMRLSSGAADCLARNAHLIPPSRLRGHPPQADAQPTQGEADLAADEAAAEKALLEGLLHKYLLKLYSERQARLAGEVVAADFYVRQISFFEVAIDLTADRIGLDAFELLAGLRRGDHRLFDIAQTPMSQLLDERRRALWARLEEPERPPPPHYLEHYEGCSVEPRETIRGGEDHAAKEAEFKARHAAAAEAQLEWESRAMAEHKEQSQATRDLCEEPSPAGQPAPGLDPGDRIGSEADRRSPADSLRDGPPADARHPANDR